MSRKGSLKGNVQIGSIFGRLRVVDGPVYFSTSGKIKRPHWECSCSCGKKCFVFHYNLIKGWTNSCGCYRLERIHQVLFKHGESGRANDRSSASSEWIAWSSMKDRCCNSKNEAYKYYGGRGITICERWIESYLNFISDMGKKPTPRHSIDRINVDGPYSPDNCRWATQIQQAGNKSNNVNLTFDGETHCIAEWCRKLGLKEPLIRKRISKGWDSKKALTTPLRSSSHRRYMET